MRITRRWLVPVGISAVVALLSTVPHARAAKGDPKLAPMTPVDLLTAVRSTAVHTFSGTVRIDAALGLPSLPDSLAGNAMGLPDLLTGSHDLRVAVDGPDHQRVGVLGNLSETDLVHNGTDVWTYDSSRNAVTHRVLTSGEKATSAASPSPIPSADPSPITAAQKLLDKLDPTTAVTTDGTTRVAGLPAYVLVLTPKTAGTLVGSVRIAVGATNLVPLQVQLTPTNSSRPALTVGFTDVNFGAPSPDTFRFTPPAGATVSEVAGRSSTASTSPDGSASPTDKTVGTGWTRVFQVPADLIDATGSDQAPAQGDHGSSLNHWLDRIGTTVPQGHVLSTRLFSILITPDGRLFIGAVPAAAVEAAAAAPQVPAPPSPAPSAPPTGVPSDAPATATPSATP
jgi:outer membrane lipoprotein-sorting protein